jgi:hypothetical protein
LLTRDSQLADSEESESDRLLRRWLPGEVALLFASVAAPVYSLVYLIAGKYLDALYGILIACGCGGFLVVERWFFTKQN